MKTSKRLLSLLLALTMVLSLMGNLSVAAFAEEVTPTVVTTDGNDQPTTPVTPDEGQTTPANADKSGGETPAPANGDANAEPVPAEGEVTTPAVAVPKLKDGVSPTASARVMTGTPYLLADLQYGRIFDPVDGKGLLPSNYYYERSVDGGKTWDARIAFQEAMFGQTTIQITEMKAGTYIYRFYASYDGVNFSTDTWTLTLTVEDDPTIDISIFVGKDYTGGYPVIKLYNVTKDADGNEVLGDELKDVFLYSNFTNTPAEGEDEYDVAGGKLVDNYQMFYTQLKAGRYAYRAFTADGKALGGMTLDLPTGSNVDGGAGGGNKLYLQCNSFYVSTKKADNTYFTADQYHVRLACPVMGCDATMGTPYVNGNYTYYPVMLYAAGNACLYNAYAYPDIEGYIFNSAINLTFNAGYSAANKAMTLNPGITLTVTAPANATFGLYFQWNNFNTTEVEPETEWTTSADGKTKTAQYFISKGSGSYTWRLNDATHVTQAGWLGQLKDSGELTYSFADGAATDRISHDFSNLGSQVINRDEADLQVNLDPSGYEAITGTTRIRAYRHWQLINSDAANIMVEPDFHWNALTGDAQIKPVNGGNATANWADVTPGTQDSIIAVYYDSVDVNPGNHGSHGGLFPATNPERVAVMVVGGTGTSHGTADADVKFNKTVGSTPRSEAWDYNYDTWFYEANETNPALDFTVNATGSVKVEYALAATDNSMKTTVSGFQSVSADADGNYAVPLAGFNTIGNGKGGTVILKMTDSTGVSYRLVRVAKVTITAENVSNPGENIMPGDQVKLSFDGMYRAVNKISGIFNPTIFKPTYFAGETKYEGTLGQYQKMDNATVTVTIPEDVTFADGAATAQYTLTNGYTYGSMYAAANPFAFLYSMTDTGVGTNFNAVTVNYYMNHYADAVVTVYQKVTYKTKLNITDENGKAVDGVTVTLLGRDGKTPITPNENGTYTLGYGVYTYTLSKNGYVVTRGSFSLGSADAANVKDGVLTVKTAVLPKVGENAWDGKTKTEPKKDGNGVYLIGTAAELAWFAATDGKSSAKLTADIELAGYDWTPLKKFYGTFDGQGHVIRNLYINSTSNTLGLISYLQGGASVTGLGITGSVTCTNNTRIAQAGGIVGYMYDKASITQCWSAVNVTSNKHAGGIAGYTAGGSIITNCYASGNITTTSKNECYLGGICGSGFSNTNGATLTNCYSIGDVTGTSGAASYLGGLSPDKTAAHYVDNCFYLDGTVSKESSKYGVTGLGTAKTAAEMKAAIEANNNPFNPRMLADLAVRAQEIADKAAAKNVDDLIDAIGDVTLTDDCKAKIDAARKAYDALTDAQKALVSKLDILTDAEAKLAQLKKEAADKAAVDDVIAKIDAIGKVKLDKDSKAKITAARAAYDALDDELKAQVTNYNTLLAAEKRYQQLRDKQNANDGSTSDSADGKTDSKTDGKNVKSGNTADNSHLTLWLGGVVVSAAALALLARKRRQDA